MAPLVLPQALSTLVVNNISELSMSNASRGGSFLLSTYFFYLGEQIWGGINPCP